MKIIGRGEDSRAVGAWSGIVSTISPGGAASRRGALERPGRRGGPGGSEGSAGRPPTEPAPAARPRRQRRRAAATAVARTDGSTPNASSDQRDRERDLAVELAAEPGAGERAAPRVPAPMPVPAAAARRRRVLRRASADSNACTPVRGMEDANCVGSSELDAEQMGLDRRPRPDDHDPAIAREMYPTERAGRRGTRRDALRRREVLRVR